MAIPVSLKKYEAQIRATRPEDQAIEYHAKTWGKHLGSAVGLEFIIRRFTRQVARRDLFGLAAAARDSGQIVDLQRLFVGVMIWGYGTGGRGPWRTARMISSPGYPKMLKTTYEHVIQEDLEKAYRQFNLKWCGPAYFTKYFYFIGKGCGIREYPLILDKRVKTALGLIGEDVIDYTNYQDWYPAGYTRYVKAIHRWAVELGCQADQIEYFLFKLTEKK
jgi:hypothetical protein